MARGFNSTKNQKAYFREWVKNSETVHQNKWFKLVQNNNFYSIDYHAVQVVVLPVIEEEYILLSKVKRPIVGCSLWECPAGGVEESETNEIAALRELKEETGVVIKDSSRLNPLQSLIVSQNRLPMFPAIFSIQLSEEEYQLRKSHDKEVEASKRFSFAEIIEMMKSGDISTAITLSILGRFFLEQGKIIL